MRERSLWHSWRVQLLQLASKAVRRCRYLPCWPCSQRPPPPPPPTHPSSGIERHTEPPVRRLEFCACSKRSLLLPVPELGYEQQRAPLAACPAFYLADGWFPELFRPHRAAPELPCPGGLPRCLVCGIESSATFLLPAVPAAPPCGAESSSATFCSC